MPELTSQQKKDWAKTLYLKENLTQQEIADKVGVSRQTVIRWIKNEHWDDLKTSLTLTREEQIANLYRQVSEINRAIISRPDGERYANSKEADTIGKLAKTIKQLETEVGLSEITSAFSGLIKWLRQFDVEQAKIIAPVLDAYVKSKLI